MIDQTKIKCSICGAWYLYNGFGAKKTCFCVEDNNDQPESEVSVDKRVSPKSTDIEKQESIVIILSDMITEIADRREILDEHLVNRMTHQEQRIIGETLKKLLALDNLKVVTII